MGEKKTVRRTGRYAYRPDYAVPPGNTLQETIDALGMDQKELALRTGLNKKTINQIIKGIHPLTPETALRLERSTGVPAVMWNNLESNYRDQLARLLDEETLAEHMDWLKSVPLKELTTRGLIQPCKEKLEQLRQVLKFYGVANVEAWHQYWEQPTFAFRKSPSFEGKTAAIAAWLRACELAATDIETEPFSKKDFRTSLKKARQLTTQEPSEYISALKDLCSDSGVALVLLKEIRGAPISGAAKWLHKDKAMIALTLRGKRNDRFWFSFFHEAGHIVNDGKKETFVDSDENKGRQEERADRFAADFLIPRRHLKELETLEDEEEVNEFAYSIGVHPGIVVGRLQNDGLLDWSEGNDLKQTLDWDSIPA